VNVLTVAQASKLIEKLKVKAADLAPESIPESHAD
jgi:hypothetical protein